MVISSPMRSDNERRIPGCPAFARVGAYSIWKAVRSSIVSSNDSIISKESKLSTCGCHLHSESRIRSYMSVCMILSCKLPASCQQQAPMSPSWPDLSLLPGSVVPIEVYNERLRGGQQYESSTEVPALFDHATGCYRASARALGPEAVRNKVLLKARARIGVDFPFARPFSFRVALLSIVSIPSYSRLPKPNLNIKERSYRKTYGHSRIGTTRSCSF